MPDLLLELRSEEIPARMQRKAAGDLKKLVTDGLVEAGLTYEAAREYFTPRRLALDIRGVTARSKDVRDEIKGPSTKAPEQAIQGFLRKAGLSSVADAHVHADPKKGDFYVAPIVKPGRAAEVIIAELVPGIVRDFPWPKSMRWGPASAKPGALRWVRPLQSIVCTFGPETEEPVVVDFEVGGIRAGNVTYGHRFHAPGPITVKRFDDYAARLDAAKVVLDADRRKQSILADAKNLAFANGLDLVEDEGLLEEVAGLVEWPVVLLGEFEQDFLAIPAEVIRLTIRANQKCFVTRPAESAPSSGPSGHLLPVGEKSTAAAVGSSPRRGEGGELSEPGEGALSNRFILTANIEARDGGAEIAHGNGKVVRARLSDALYFWKTDQADLPDLDQLDASADEFGLKRNASGKLLPLDQRMARLDHLNVTFHAKLGTQGERVERIARLAEELAPVVMKSISPLAGEMGGSPEGGAVPPATPHHDASANLENGRSTSPPSALPGISPSRGEITQFARRAALLAKADLTTEVVGEFPELQGLMGRKYALLQGEPPSVAAAIEEHYKPQGPSDRVPTDPVSIAVALADKLDTLVGFWAIDEKPTGSKDPYALRRAALGVIRILVENGVRLSLTGFARRAARRLLSMDFLQSELSNAAIRRIGAEGGDFSDFVSALSPAQLWTISKSIGFSLSSKSERTEFGWDVWVYLVGAHTDLNLLSGTALDVDVSYLAASGDKTLTRHINRSQGVLLRLVDEICADLLSFFHDRLKVYLRDQGARHDLIDAVLAERPTSPLRGGRTAGPGGGTSSSAGTSEPPPLTPPLKGERDSGSSNDDLLQIVRKVEALGSFLETEDGKNLLAGTKRAANILAAEEKKGTHIATAVDPALLREDAEKSLFAAVNQAESETGEAIRKEDFSAALAALSALREPVDSFFEAVLVNDEDAAVRANRLALLARIRAATDQVADFSKISG